MPERSLAAERCWYAVSPDGLGHDLVIRVSAPFVDNDIWQADVSLGVLDERRYAIAGVDSWQALYSAMRFAETCVRQFAEEGWTFYWGKGGERAAPDELLY